MIVRARAILETIIAVNQDALGILTRDPGNGIQVHRVLLTGNHDRLALHDDRLYARMREAVAATDERTLAAEGIYPHRLEMREYGLLARHGHEWDAWNLRGVRARPRPVHSYEDQDYRATPIGDPITTELAARLPYLMKQRLAATGVLTPDEVTRVYRRLQRIEDVRPLFAALHWIYYEASRFEATLDAAHRRRPCTPPPTTWCRSSAATSSRSISSRGGSTSTTAASTSTRRSSSPPCSTRSPS